MKRGTRCNPFHFLFPTDKRNRIFYEDSVALSANLFFQIYRTNIKKSLWRLNDSKKETQSTKISYLHRGKWIANFLNWINFKKCIIFTNVLIKRNYVKCDIFFFFFPTTFKIISNSNLTPCHITFHATFSIRFMETKIDPRDYDRTINFQFPYPLY